MLLKDKPMNELIRIADQIPIVPHTQKIITELKNRGYITGIISDSYDIITNHIRIKLGMDFSLSNELEFSQGICTGEVKIPSFLFNHPQSICKHTLCKTNALLSVLNQYNIKRSNAIAIGDNLYDLCMIRNAGMGVAFCSTSELVNQSADMMITEPSFSGLLNIAL
jgi:HAD superfamily phosphoserine phosphatase-like hydrolase